MTAQPQNRVVLSVEIDRGALSKALSHGAICSIRPFCPIMLTSKQ